MRRFATTVGTQWLVWPKLGLLLSLPLGLRAEPFKAR